MEKVFNNNIQVRNRPGGFSGIPTGYSYLDSITGGFQKTDLIIIGGRPGMGKTSIALNFALNAAMPSLRESKKDFPAYPVAFFSMELSCEQVLQRLICQLGQHDLSEFSTGRINDDDIPRMLENAKLLKKTPLFVEDTADLRPVELRNKARSLNNQLKNEYGQGLGLVVVDYLQLMRGNDSHNNRKEEIREISGSLKALAKEMEVPVITLSQLNRSAKMEPSLADLRGSGSIEQDADLVLFILRPEMFKKNDPTLHGKAELRIHKHRNGPTGIVYLRYIHKSSTFVPDSNFEPVNDL
jgi:replicative DNA helicase